VFRSRDAYDIAPCSACGALVNTHHNAACLISNKKLLNFPLLNLFALAVRNASDGLFFFPS